MIRILIIILVFTLIEFDHAAILPKNFTSSSSCPDGSFQGINSQDCFSYHNESTNWSDAYEQCQIIGRNLASIHDAFTNALIKRKFVENFNIQYID